MAIVQNIAGRIALVTRIGLSDLLKRRFSFWILLPIIGIVVISNIITLGVDLGAIIDATRLIIDIPFFVLLLIYTFGLLTATIFLSYKKIARICSFLVASLFAFVITGWLSVPKNGWGEIIWEIFVP